LIPTIAMGGLFSHLAQTYCTGRGGLGRALGANTVGAALAPPVAGTVLLPVLGSKTSLLLVSLAYLLFIPPGIRLRRAAWALPVLLAAVLLFGPVDFQFVTLSRGSRVMAHVEGAMAAVTVVGDAAGDFQLRVNDKFVMGGTSSYYSDRRQGQIPLLLHPDPRRALYLGLGTGATFAAVADHPNLEGDGVELIPETIPLLPFFERSTGNLAGNGRLHIWVADARRFVRATPNTYDVVVADLFHPARDGAGTLYTVEHFEAVRRILNPGGVFCQWLPLYQMDLDTFRTIARSFLEVFPEGSAYLAHYSLQNPIVGLVAGGPARYPGSWMQERILNPSLNAELKRLRLDTTCSLLGNFVAGSRELEAFAGPGPVNTDDRPVVVFEAPRFVYSRNEPPSKRLIALMGLFHPRTEDILRESGTGEEIRAHARLAAYWEARDEFLRAGTGIRPDENVEVLLGETRESLISCLRKSPDFDAAYYPLLAMAEKLGRKKPMAARELLQELERMVPQRPEARDLRTRLFPAHTP
jgi:spermidine synthase